METSEAIKTRRSVKDFDPLHKMSQKEIDVLLELATFSPTAFNIQNWRFLIARDKELRQRLLKAAYNQPQITDASLLIIICADLQAWNKNPERYWSHVEPVERDNQVAHMHNYYVGKPHVQRDEALRSCGLAAQTLMLAAKDIGYDSCPLDGFDYDHVGTLIGLPEDYLVVMMVAIGKAKGPPPPRGGKIPFENIAFIDHF